MYEKIKIVPDLEYPQIVNVAEVFRIIGDVKMSDLPENGRCRGFKKSQQDRFFSSRQA